MREKQITNAKPPLERPGGLPAPIAHHTSIVLYKLAGWIGSEMDRALEFTRLKTRHYSVLSILTYSGPWSQLAVGQKLRIDRATMVAVVDDLERLGLVERKRSLEDRRNYDLQLTDAGRETVKAAETAITTLETQLFAPLSKTQQTQMHAMISSLLRTTDQSA
jgi:DNA-binding MarR family transcriptional regulator